MARLAADTSRMRQLEHRILRVFAPGVWLLAAIGTVLAVWLSPISDPAAIAMLVVLGISSDLLAVTLKPGMRVSAAHFMAPFAIIVDSITGGVIAGSAFLLARAVFRREDFRRFDVAVNVTASLACGGVVALASALLPPTTSQVAELLGYFAVVAIFATTRAELTRLWALDTQRRTHSSSTNMSRRIWTLMLACALVFTPALYLFVNSSGPAWERWSLLIIPMLSTQFLVRAFGRELRLNESLSTTLARAVSLSDELAIANVAITESLVAALEARDEYTAGHSLAVAVYSRDIALELGLPLAQIERVYIAGLLHDIGKIAVSDAILHKPGRLTDAEYEEIKRHPVVGEIILAPVHRYQDLLPGVRHHHERIDGTGYPDQLAGDQIPLQARIIAVADAYNAMTSRRAYRDAMPPVRALEILDAEAGTQHDPEVLRAFHEVLASRGVEYGLARGNEFTVSREIRDLLDSGVLRPTSLRLVS